MNMFECPFSMHARKKGEKSALISDEKIWSYLECEKLIAGMITILRARGIKEGDTVALLPTKSFPTPLLFFALFRIHAICAPLNTYYPLSQLPKQLDKLQARFLLYPDEVKLPKIKQIPLSFSTVVQRGKYLGQTFLYKGKRATYLSTSGTTAEPKVACHTLGNHYYSALGSNRYLPLEPGDRYHLSLPLYHIAGVAILFRTFLAGAAVALGTRVSGITHRSLVPTQLKRLLEGKEVPSYKHLLIGGAPLPHKLYRKAVQWGLPLHLSYGMTEMSSQVATHFGAHFFSLGHPLPYRELKIDAEGKIFVRGKTLFQGYLRNDGTLELPLDSEGFFATGDMGTYSHKTGLHIWGRQDRLFISGGENIQPEEIEKIISNIDGIDQVRVIPTQDSEYGFRPAVYIESNKDYKEEELKKYLRTLLPNFKVPIAFFSTRSLPPQ